MECQSQIMISMRSISLNIAAPKSAPTSESTPRRLYQCHASQLLDRFVRDRHVERKLVAKWLLMEGEWE
ncbi:MAG: hypothetical protein KME17_16685 [Cyanosarcina radialis HA8281-LM2]|nr:hypothetical protein [Cyanosarcina radialis HA8281-LM2]